MRLIGFAALLAAAMATGAAASGVVAERVERMKEMSNATKALGAMKLGLLGYAPDTVRRAAQTVAAAARAARADFPAGSGGGETEALPLIWEERARFDALFDDLAAAAERLAAAAEAEDAAFPLIDEVGAGCKACHQRYRKP